MLRDLSAEQAEKQAMQQKLVQLVQKNQAKSAYYEHISHAVFHSTEWGFGKQ